MVRSKADILNSIGKQYFTLADLEKVFHLERASLLVTLARMVKSGQIARLSRGLYQALPGTTDIEKVATQLYQPSYVSFESALAEYGILSQIPYGLTLATVNKPKKILLDGQDIIYRRLRRDLFFGFLLTDGIYIASPEKALLDLLYMQTKGRAQINLDELNLKIIDKKKILSFAKKYPSAVLKLCKSLLSKTN